MEDVVMSAVALAQDAMLVHDVEVSARRPRRRFAAAYKLQVLEEAAACTRPGELGAMLRREGLYSSLLAVWRTSARRGELAGLSQRRGPKPARRTADTKRLADLERQVVRLTARAEHAEALVELQKKVALLLGRPRSIDEPSGPR